MRYEYTRAFIRDTKKLPEDIRADIKAIIEQVNLAAGLVEIGNLKKMKGFSNAYRVRIGDYRIGIFLEEDTVIFARVLHRKEVYRFFP
ncbi:type II toxin-antitoxin system RelE family toxin [Dyadobacter luticola]|uniref:Type II toxin-antitoxin system RelE/ParE family toxin n=1 Tax=Dyadobacter luticola TaxID=1979387 RepID=A0A5R9KSQ2_9BACT|nr:type II toxin-antitoxin system RelE/ParE family toxin [Dyadobacter luticola]TLU99134.1 type II toxin-antitoxin system RelE/ParE family toxin [Dyadobacter luticola]